MDVVSNVDPVHIGLPWAAVRVLLQVWVNLIELVGTQRSGTLLFLAGLQFGCYYPTRNG